MINIFFLLTKITLFTGLIVVFYHYFKLFIIRQAGYIALKVGLTKRYTFEVAKGAIELPLIVGAHLLFCVFLIWFFHVSWKCLGLFSLPSPLFLIYGLMLGLGIMGTASLLGRLYIEILRLLWPSAYPQDMRDWLSMARSGWIRHHFHTLEVFPLPVALSITFLQVCAEEIVFRGVIINCFISYGWKLALLISIVLFMVMQLFHMPNRTAGAFPVIGAFVMGTVGGVLYLHFPLLLPLMIAHIMFFAAAVL